MYTIFYAVLLALCITFAPGYATAQLSSRPITIVVPYPPGGPYDIFARLIAPKLSKNLGQPVVIENRGGANGNIGADFVRKADPNGRTLLLMGSVHVINASLYKNLNYSVTKDLVAVAPIATSEFVLLIHPSIPANSVQQLLALAKSKPDTLTYATGGSGSVGHLAAVMMNSMAGTKMVHVPYKGAGPALTDLMGGQVSMLINTVPASLQHVKAGTVKALAVTSLKKSSLLPELPTIAQSGLPGYEATSWFGIAAPAATPQELVRSLNTEIRKVVQDPETQKQMQTQGGEPMVMSPEEFSALVQADIVKWAKVVKESGATVD